MPLGAQASRLRPSRFWLRIGRGRDAHAPRGSARIVLIFYKPQRKRVEEIIINGVGRQSLYNTKTLNLLISVVQIK